MLCLSVDIENKKVEMSFRSGDLTKKSSSSSGLSLGDLHEGQKVDGVIKKIEDYGLFIQIDGSKLSGLCHKSEVGQSFSSSSSFLSDLSRFSSLTIKRPTLQLHCAPSARVIE